jgi:hypothetical protein
MDEHIVSVRVGRLLPGAQEVGEGVNLPVRGIAATADGEIAVIAKKLCGREIAVEVICAALGRAAGIPIPEPLLLLDPNDCWHFGSADIGHPNLSKFVSHQDSSVLDELERWPDLLAAACFDELIANPDRHDGNILYNGNGFLLIDHGLCLPHGMQPDDRSEDYHTNRFLETIINVCRDEVAQQRAVNSSREWVQSKSIPATSSAEKSVTEQLNPEARDQLISFLKSRVSILGDLLHEKIKPSQGSLKLDD